MSIIHSKSSLILFLLIVLTGEISFAQQKPQPQPQISNLEQRQFRQAQSYQRRNQHEDAIRILEPLYRRNVGNVAYYKALLESYLQISLTGRAKELVEQQKNAQPGNPTYDVDYGNVLFQENQKEQALEVWNGLLKTYSGDVGIYTLVANEMARNRLDEEAADVYLKAYKQNPDKVYLLKTIGDFYRNLLNYEAALKYYFEYIRKEPESYRNVIRQILAFRLEDDAQIESVLKTLREETRKSPDLPEIQIITGKFFQKYARYEEALAVYEQLENGKSQGQYLLEFAREVQADSVYRLALRAYGGIIERFPQSNYLLPAYLGAAECNMAIAGQEEDQSYARQAVDMIHKVQAAFPNHGQVAQLSLLEGDIQREFFFDIDKAIEIYLQVAQKYNRDSAIRERAYRSAGESYIMRGDLDNAAKILQKVTAPEEKPQAAYDLARIAFFRGEYAEARNHLNTIITVEGLSGSTVNDVLALQGILMNEETAPEALALFAEAQWLIYQQKKSEAVSKLHSALEKNPPPTFRIRILFDAAHLLTELEKYPDALSYCNRVLEDTQLAFYADEAIFIMAGIYDDKLNDHARAFQLYERILAEFDHSQFTIPSRERLKAIRQQYPDLMP